MKTNECPFKVGDKVRVKVNIAKNSRYSKGIILDVDAWGMASVHFEGFDLPIFYPMKLLERDENGIERAKRCLK